MKTTYKIYKLFLISLTFLLLCLPIHADTNQNDESERFLKWYEENKEVGYSDYTLKADLYLDAGTKKKPILLDGNGRLTVNCAGYSIYVRSSVIIDNDHLTIYTFSINGENKPPLIVENGLSNEAILTLKHGYIGGNTDVPALFVKSGEVQCIKEAPRFTLYGVSNVIEIASEDSTLENLNIEASDGIGDVVGVKAHKNITLKNCNVNINAQSDANVVGILAGNDINIIDSDIQVNANHAVSVKSDAGLEHIYVKDSSLFPEMDKPWDNDDVYRVVNVHYPILSNIPYGIQKKDLKLPETMQVDLAYLDGREGIITTDISVIWNTVDLKDLLSEYGVHTISGEFSSGELASKHIYIENSYVARFTFKVITDKIMNELLFSKIEMNVKNPFVNLYFYRPYLAQTMILQYSENGIDWVDGYLIREKDQVRDSNLLNASINPEDRELVSVYFPKITKQGILRVVIKGGVFDGIYKNNAIDMDKLFTPPGEDGSGGNRGGGGQFETGRETRDGKSDDSSLQPKTEQNKSLAERIPKQKQTQGLNSMPVSNESYMKQETNNNTNYAVMCAAVGIGIAIVIIGVGIYTKKQKVK